MKILLTILLIVQPFWPQGPFRLIKEVVLKADYITSDNLGNVYVVRQDELTKYSKEGELLLTYSDKSLGEITMVDVRNPLKILLYYQDLSSVVFLDNRLSRIGDHIALDQMGLEQSTLACTSHSNGIWLYDPLTFQLSRLDQFLKIERQTQNINQLLGHEIIPNFLLEANNWVYLNDPETGIHVFDIYGTYYKTIQLKGLTEFQILDNNLYFRSNDEMMWFDLRSLQTKQLELPTLEYKAVRVLRDRYCFLTEQGLKIYAVRP